MSGDALLEVSGVSKRFGGLQALSKVDFSVAEGSIHAIIGPNGAGKSTLLNVLIGLIEADEGPSSSPASRWAACSPHTIIQRGIARVFQTPQIFPAMTLVQNVAIAALAKRDGEFRPQPRGIASRPSGDARRREMLARVGLGESSDQEAPST